MVGAPVEHLIALVTRLSGSFKRFVITFDTEVGDVSEPDVLRSPARITGFFSAPIHPRISVICFLRHSGLHFVSRCGATTVTAPVGDSGTVSSTMSAVRPPRRTSRVILSMTARFAPLRLPASTLEISFFSPRNQSQQTGRDRMVALRIGYRLRTAVPCKPR